MALKWCQAAARQVELSAAEVAGKEMVVAGEVHSGWATARHWMAAVGLVLG